MYEDGDEDEEDRAVYEILVAVYEILYNLDPNLTNKYIYIYIYI